MISALLINLDSSPERLTFQQNQLQRLNIGMERLTAIPASGLTTVDYEHLANSWERKMRLAEVACFLSHKSAWQWVADANRPMLIMEDDALLSNKVPQILTALAQQQHLDYVTLETRNRYKLLDKTTIDLTPDHSLRRLYQDRSGAAAYVLFPSGAQKLLAQLVWKKPALADAFLCRAYNLNAWQIFPAVAIQTDQCINYGLKQINPFSSTITPTDNIKPQANNLYDYWCFKYRRLAAQCRMGWRRWSVSAHSERVNVSINPTDFF